MELEGKTAIATDAGRGIGKGIALVIDRMSVVRAAGAHAMEKQRNLPIGCQSYACEHGIDKPEMDQWKWMN